MSSIKLSPNASGTGSLTIAAPNTNSDRTLTLPDESGTLLSSGGPISVNASAPTSAVTLDASGNWLLGSTSSPGTIWSGDRTFAYVKGSATNRSGEVIVESNNGNQQASFFASGGSAEFGLWSTKASAILFGNNNTERARIDSSGNLLVGTTVFNAGTINSVTKTGYWSLALRDNVGNGSLIEFKNPSNTQVGTIQTNGTTTSYNTSSDYRLKENIQPMTGALAKVAQLKPCTYKWKADGSDGEGFIAHELAEVVPQCVTGEKDAVDAEGKPVYQGIDTSFLVATLTAAIQEQQALITQLQADVAALKGTA